MLFYKRIFAIVIIHCLVIFYTVESTENDDSSITPPSAKNTKKTGALDVASPKHKHRHHHKAKQAEVAPTEDSTNPDSPPAAKQAKIKKPKSFRAKAGDVKKQPHSDEKAKKTPNEPAPSVEKLKSRESQEQQKKSSEEKGENISNAKSKEEGESKDSLRNGDDDDDDSGDRKITGIPLEEADPDPKDTKNIHQQVESKDGETPDRVASADKNNSGSGEK